MKPSEFSDLVARLTATIAHQPLDATLARHLNETHGPGSAMFDALFAACRAGVAEGWMCQREANGLRYGRVIKPSTETHGFSVDVVDMTDLVGPHHRHPRGEIDLIMPLAGRDDLSPGGQARFDGQSAGWKVYPPGSTHCPTVSDGRALVLYLLPGGAIDFVPAAHSPASDGNPT